MRKMISKPGTAYYFRHCHLFLINLIAVVVLTACGGGGSSGSNEVTVQTEDRLFEFGFAWPLPNFEILEANNVDFENFDSQVMFSARRTSDNLICRATTELYGDDIGLATIHSNIASNSPNATFISTETVTVDNGDAIETVVRFTQSSNGVEVNGINRLYYLPQDQITTGVVTTYLFRCTTLVEDFATNEPVMRELLDGITLNRADSMGSILKPGSIEMGADSVLRVN